MKSLIIYGSQYGTTKSYADKFSEITKIPVINYQDVNNISDFDLIIYFGGLYAGGVKGLKRTIKLLKDDAKLIIVTVGLADVNNKENIDNIKKSINKQVPKKVLDNATIINLRGGIDYSKLNFKHKTMMYLLYNKIKNIPEEEKTAEIKAMIETFNKKVNFVDYNSLFQIIETMERYK